MLRAGPETLPSRILNLDTEKAYMKVLNDLKRDIYLVRA